MSKSQKPYLTVIGNHDHLSNGKVIYEQLYGPRNYSFVFNDVKFVMWDNVLWESNLIPDWNWFRHEVSLASENRSIRHVIPCSHIPPTDGQLQDSARAIHELFVQNQIAMSVHGHKHEYSNEELYGEGIRYITIGSPDKRSYVELSISADSLTAEKVFF
jgi:3',5'-cyclic-AMP phosphodiesterase